MLSRNDVLQKVNFYKTRKAIYNTDVVNRRNLLLFGTTAIRGGVEQCTSVYIAQRRVLLCKNSPLHGTTDIRVRFEMYILVNSWTRGDVSKVGYFLDIPVAIAWNHCPPWQC